MQEFLAWIIVADHKVFQLINQNLASEHLDGFFQTVTYLHKVPIVKFFVIPLFIGFGIYKYKKKFLKWMLALAIVAGITDAFNYRVLKQLSQRSRPAFVPEVNAQLRGNGTPSDPSFPSNHAVNTMAGATLLSAAMPHLAPAFYILAALVVYSRPYLGVHFPIDVLVGALLGFLFAKAMVIQIFRRFDWWEFPKSTEKPAPE